MERIERHQAKTFNLSRKKTSGAYSIETDKSSLVSKTVSLNVKLVPHLPFTLQYAHDHDFTVTTR